MTKLFLTLSIFAFAFNGYSQDNGAITKSEDFPALLDREFDNGSNITFPEITDSLISDLACLGKVWGFVKYNHPAVAQGKYNMDSELFRFLPQFLAANNRATREKLMLAWINGFGELSGFPRAKGKSKNVFSKQNLDWIASNIQDASLREKLYQVHARRNQGEHFYVGSDPEVPTFLHEEGYANMPFPDAGFRLLSLYKHWNIVDCFFPYKHLTEKPWSDVLTEYIPSFLSVESELEYELVLLKIIGELHDTHANLWDGSDKIYYWRGEYYPPFHARLVENQLLVDDFFNLDKMEATGVKVGDVITHINGKHVSAIVDSLMSNHPASNRAAKMRDVSYDILRHHTNELDITYQSSNVSKEEKITLYRRKELNYFDWYKRSNEKGYKLLTNDILYLNMALLRDTDNAAVEELLKKVKGVVVDVRNYPDLMAVYTLLPYFQTTKKPFAVFTHRNIHNPREFTWTKPQRTYGNKNPFSGKVVVLANEITQSFGEFTVMAFRATGNCTVIGSQTAGADGRIAYIVLPGGIKTSISGYGVYYPDKTQTQRIGIVPDIEMKPTIKTMQEGRDELIEKAMEVIGE